MSITSSALARNPRWDTKNLIPLFTADRWDPEHLMDLYAKAGAKYFFSMGVHHGQTLICGIRGISHDGMPWRPARARILSAFGRRRRAARVRFGVSEHLSNSFDWFAPAHLADTKGRYAGVPYDGSDPRFADLYHDYRAQSADFAATAKDMGRVAPDSWKLTYFRRIKDLIDQHQPDLLYTDWRHSL